VRLTLARADYNAPTCNRAPSAALLSLTLLIKLPQSFREMGVNNSNILTAAAAVAAAAVALLPTDASAEIVTPSTPVTITQSYAYSNFDGGDFVFSTSAGAPGCASGWYVKPTDGGYRSIIAEVLTAQAAGLPVVVYGDNSDLWAGSPSGQYCRVQTVGVSS
jgi:hypothetical protein